MRVVKGLNNTSFNEEFVPLLAGFQILSARQDGLRRSGDFQLTTHPGRWLVSTIPWGNTVVLFSHDNRGALHVAVVNAHSFLALVGLPALVASAQLAKFVKSLIGYATREILFPRILTCLPYL